jgi:hypothetical protein
LRIAVIGVVLGLAAIAAGIAWGLHLDYPAPSGGRDLPVSTILLNVLSFAVPGFLLFAVSLSAMTWQPRVSRWLITATAALLACLSLYVAIDITSQTEQADDAFFGALLVLGNLVPIAALGLACLYGAEEEWLQSRTSRLVVAVICIALIIAAGAYAVWFHENRSYDTSGNLWLFLGIFAWSSGWALAMLTTTLPRAGAPVLLACRAGGLLLLVFAAGYAIDVNGERDVLWVLSGVALRVAALGLLVLVLSGVRMGLFAGAAGVGVMLLAFYQAYDGTAIYRREFIGESWIWLFLTTAVVPATVGALLAVVGLTRADRQPAS